MSGDVDAKMLNSDVFKLSKGVINSFDCCVIVTAHCLGEERYGNVERNLVKDFEECFGGVQHLFFSTVDLMPEPKFELLKELARIKVYKMMKEKC